MAVRSKLWVCGRSIGGVEGSNAAGCMGDRLLSMLCN
jgi:hypothetical protein